MIDFQLIRTARFAFRLQELTLADCRALLNIAPNLSEKARSEFLRRAIAEFHWAKGYENLALGDLTAQERLFIEACYLSQVSEMSDFELGNGRYTDFLQVEKQYAKSRVELGAIDGDEDNWALIPLTGLMLEAMEERLANLDKCERIDWILFAMAATLTRDKDKLPDINADFIAYGDALEARANAFAQLPSSAFVQLLTLFFQGMAQLTHFFTLNFDSDGVYLLPIEGKTVKGEEALVLPARFRANAVIDVITQNLLR